MKRVKRPCYCFNLRRASNTVADFYDRALQGIGLTTAQFLLLSSLGQMESASVSELASFVELERTTVARTAKPLLEKGYILDAAEKGSRDRKLILSGSGAGILKQGEAPWLEAQSCITRKIGEEKARELLEILQKLTE